MVPGVLSWLAPVLPRIRYKTLPARLLGGENGTKFSLLGFLVVRTVQNSPCMQKQRQIEPFWASGESFVPDMRREGVCWESFVPHVRRARVCWESFVPHVRRARVCWESFVPKRQGVVLVGRVVLCSGVVLVPVGGLWRRPGAAHGRCGRAPLLPVPSMPVVGFLQHEELAGGVSSACRTLAWRNSPDWRRRSRCSRRCGAHIADHLGEKR